MTFRRISANIFQNNYTKKPSTFKTQAVKRKHRSSRSLLRVASADPSRRVVLRLLFGLRPFSRVKMEKIRFNFVIFLVLSLFSSHTFAEIDEDTSTDLYVIEGKVFPWENSANTGWQLMTHVMANGGEHIGFLRYEQFWILQIITWIRCFYDAFWHQASGNRTN